MKFSAISVPKPDRRELLRGGLYALGGFACAACALDGLSLIHI